MQRDTAAEQRASEMCLDECGLLRLPTQEKIASVSPSFRDRREGLKVDWQVPDTEKSWGSCTGWGGGVFGTRPVRNIQRAASYESGKREPPHEEARAKPGN